MMEDKGGGKGGGYDAEEVGRERGRGRYRVNAVASRRVIHRDKSLIIQIKAIIYWREERRASTRQTGETALIYNFDCKIVTMSVISLS